MQKFACAIVGAGNIGTGLVYRLRRSFVRIPACLAGIDKTSEGWRETWEPGLKATGSGVNAHEKAVA
jgi:acetaldehyde/propanal dehydrogenase